MTQAENQERDRQFTDRELKDFFSNPVWKEISVLVEENERGAIQTLSSIKSTHEEDLVAKGVLSICVFVLNIEEALTEPNENEEAQ